MNIVALAQKKYNTSLGLWPVAPLAFLFVTGLYLFVLPYAQQVAQRQRTD